MRGWGAGGGNIRRKAIFPGRVKYPRPADNVNPNIFKNPLAICADIWYNAP